MKMDIESNKDTAGICAREIKDLILDIKIVIASSLKDDIVWYRMWLYDEEFRKYAMTKDGTDKFIQLYTKVEEGVADKKYVNYKLFGKLHSVYDQPAFIFGNNEKNWYYHGLRHRGNDLPAIIFNGDFYKITEWWIHGKCYRENGPARISESKK